MVGGGDHRQPVVAKRQNVYARARLWVRHQPDLSSAQNHVVIHLVAAPIVEPHVHFGMGLQQRALNALQLVQANRIDGRNRCGAGHFRGLLADFPFDLPKPGEDFFAPPKEPLACRCRRHLPRAPRKEFLLVAIL